MGRVIDGDTFVLLGGERIRIAGIDAAETQPKQAQCRAEIVTRVQATADARRLIEGRTVTLVRVGRSYNRTVARVSLDDRDVASALVDTGAARWWPRGTQAFMVSKIATLKAVTDRTLRTVGRAVVEPGSSKPQSRVVRNSRPIAGIARPDAVKSLAEADSRHSSKGKDRSDEYGRLALSFYHVS